MYGYIIYDVSASKIITIFGVKCKIMNEMKLKHNILICNIIFNK
jgi:hypothetical protein